MNFLNFTWYYIVIFLIILTVLVFVHEMGHFWVARRNRVRVEVFSIGFGPEIYGWTDRLGTRWKISAIPLGGYVKMFGENAVPGDAEEERPLTPEERAVSFHNKSLGQRSAIVAAGPIANFLFAIVLFAGIFAFVGKPAPLAAVGAVQPESAAAEAGLQSGDRILSINGEAITWFEDLRRIVSANPSVRLELTVRRNGSEMLVPATPKRYMGEEGPDEVREIGRLGVSPDPEQVEFERFGPLTAAWMGVERTANMTMQILTYLGQLIDGSRTTDELGGPLRIAQLSGTICQIGLADCIFLMAAISVNLGLINLFPVPVLDGGRLAFYAVEVVLGRPLSRRVQEYSLRFGLTLVLLLMIFVTWKDLGHLFLDN
ncbi:MAG: RIP metalloprotease RseP [Alphaproteobacteria bacterium]|nr:RIP metalloprotease RseP [Alphaproteobacteria bacterium]